MPNRIIKESICTSDEIDKLTWFEEVLFYRLIVKCDDFGRYDGRPKIIKGQCFPLKDITVKDIEKGLNKLSAEGLVKLYTVDERPFLQLTTWSKHQTIRNKKSKYPSVEEGKLQTSTLESNCMQLNANVPVIQSNPIRIQSEYNSPVSPDPLTDVKNCDSFAREVIDYLNEKTGSSYRYSETSLRPIRARLKEKFTVENCKTVIDKKTEEWKGTEWEKYLRPETLFGSKFENYLNAKSSRSVGKRKDVLPEYYNANPVRSTEEEPASPEEVAAMKKLLAEGRKKEE